MHGYDALRESAGFWEIHTRGRLNVTGVDRDTWMQAIAANDVAQLQPGQGLYTLFLNAQGRIQSDAYVYPSGDAYLLDCEAAARATLMEYLEQYIIMEDVLVEDATANHAALACEGPRAATVLADALGVDPAAELHTHGGDSSLRWFFTSRTGQPGAYLLFPESRLSEIEDRLEQAGAERASGETAEIVRIEQGQPRFGFDFTAKNIPHETGLHHGFSTNKGCYPGQEIVERVRTQGQVNRLLCSVTIDTARVPAPGAEITLGDKTVGTLTSPVLSFRLGCAAGFAILRRTALEDPAELRCAGALVTPTQVSTEVS